MEPRAAAITLFTVSVVALDLKTGAYKWHFQEVHHDIWDYDSAAAPVLADVRYQGSLRKILMHTGKTGFLYVLDRTTGKPLVGIEEREVPQEPRMKTARTQPVPARRFVRSDLSGDRQRAGGDAKHLHLRNVLDRASRDGSRNAGRNLVGADDI